MYTLPRRGVQRGGTPSAGSRGDIPPARGYGGKWALDEGSRVASSDGGLGAKPFEGKFSL
jgi:hypothetical protein